MISNNILIQTSLNSEVRSEEEEEPEGAVLAEPEPDSDAERRSPLLTQLTNGVLGYIYYIVI